MCGIPRKRKSFGGIITITLIHICDINRIRLHHPFDRSVTLLSICQCSSQVLSWNIRNCSKKAYTNPVSLVWRITSATQNSLNTHLMLFLKIVWADRIHLDWKLHARKTHPITLIALSYSLKIRQRWNAIYCTFLKKIGGIYIPKLPSTRNWATILLYRNYIIHSCTSVLFPLQWKQVRIRWKH